VETLSFIIVRLRLTSRHSPGKHAASFGLRPTSSIFFRGSQLQSADKQNNDLRQAPHLHTTLLVLNFPLQKSASIMLFSKEYVGYLAREVSKKLVASGLIETKAMPALNEKVHAALLDELGLEDRINDEVRVILEAYSEEMQKSGANYQEMFRKVKTELTKKYKAVL
jgi:hypothetical protein